MYRLFRSRLNRSSIPSRRRVRSGVPVEALEPRCLLTLVVPELSSAPGSNFTIYLDFDGHVTENTSWNGQFGFNNPTINSPGYNIDGDPANFSNTELNRINEAWARVSEDFRPFDVNVTTVDPGIEALRKTDASDTGWGVRVVITDDTESTGAGGVAYLGSFNWNNDTPAFVYTTGGKSMAEAISHEVGHTLYLTHDGNPNVEYYSGHGAGETGWAPIMGVGYNRNVTQWDDGTYFGHNNGGATGNFGDRGGDDLVVITTHNGFTYRGDDHASTSALATPLTQVNLDLTGNGIIETRDDVDYFMFTTGSGRVQIDITPFTPGPNLDIKADLYNDAGDLIATSDDETTLSATFDEILLQGDYFIAIDGVGWGTPTAPNPVGYSDYGSLGLYNIAGTISTQSNIPSLLINDATVDEDAGVANFTVSLDQPVLSVVTADYVSSNETASAGSDYGFVVGQVSFAPGEQQKTIAVPITDDSEIEADETFKVTLWQSSGARILNGEGIGTIVDNDTVTAPPMQVSVDDAQVVENGGTLRFRVHLSQPATVPVSVQFQTANGTAIAGSDFTSRTGQVSFQIGEREKFVDVAVINDQVVESDETMTLELTSAVGATIADDEGTGTIQDDESSNGPTITVSNVSRTEGNLPRSARARRRFRARHIPFRFRVELSERVNRTVRVNFETVDGSATGRGRGRDFNARRGTVTFRRGRKVAFATVWVRRDAAIEGDETFGIRLFNARGAALERDFAMATIRNDDFRRGRSFADVSDMYADSSEIPWYIRGRHVLTLIEADFPHDETGEVDHDHDHQSHAPIYHAAPTAMTAAPSIGEILSDADRDDLLI